MPVGREVERLTVADICVVLVSVRINQELGPHDS
jgi:hypothetical protein